MNRFRLQLQEIESNIEAIAGANLDICCQSVTLHLIQRFYIIDLQWYGLHITSYRQTPNPEIEQPTPTPKPI